MVDSCRTVDSTDCCLLSSFPTVKVALLAYLRADVAPLASQQSSIRWLYDVVRHDNFDADTQICCRAG